MKSETQIIQFPSEEEYKIEFLIGDDVSMRSSSREIHWKIEYNYVIATLKARTKQQAKEYICECMDVLEWIE
jgi:hypothetical protein